MKDSNNGWPGTPLYTSSSRLQEGEMQLFHTGDQIWFGFLKRESSIMLRRAIVYWFKVRFWRKPWIKLLQDSDSERNQPS